MIRFSQEKVLLLHKLITGETGGDPNIRDLALLDHALESAFQTLDGQKLYPAKEEKGARIGYALISNHAFFDGNKRIGMYVLLTFLEVNGIRIYPSEDEVVRVGPAVASGRMKSENKFSDVFCGLCHNSTKERKSLSLCESDGHKYEELLAWIHENKQEQFFCNIKLNSSNIPHDLIIFALQCKSA